MGGVGVTWHVCCRDCTFEGVHESDIISAMAVLDHRSETNHDVVRAEVDDA